MEYRAKHKAVRDRQIRFLKVKCDRERRIVAKFLNPHCREKPLLRYTHPYRKPTQVDEEKIHRPTGEVLLRNSAKWPRNLGIRGAYESRSQKRGSSDCLAKTQVYAKPKGDVYGLTPARCRKVKRRG